MQGAAFIFINFEQAVRFGHVAWGFCLDLEHDRYYFGSTDHLYRHPWWDLLGWIRYAHVAPHLNNDWWAQTGSKTEMLTTMSTGHHLRYHAYKTIPVQNADPERAIACAEALCHGGWSVLSNNCVHQTQQVLQTYGAVFPLDEQSLTGLIPRRWFANLPGKTMALPANLV